MSAELRRRELLALLAVPAFLATPACTRGDTGKRRRTAMDDAKNTAQRGGDRMPVLFLSHGSPMNAILDNSFSRGLRALGEALPDYRAVLAISAHWYVPGTYLTGEAAPKTIHDFGGFPRELHEIQYPARGDSELARRVATMLAARGAELRTDWGLDHGTWSMLRHVRPAADKPVVQLSIDHRLKPAEHLAIGKALAPLREQGVLIVGSGNATHNLRYAMAQMQRDDQSVPDWSSRFDRDLAQAFEQRDEAFLVRALETDDGRASHPSPDHYFPLLYAAGATSPGDAITYPVEGFDASLSMRSVRWG
jgi:4,5-DOPA dioxygenase extradiol